MILKPKDDVLCRIQIRFPDAAENVSGTVGDSFRRRARREVERPFVFFRLAVVRLAVAAVDVGVVGVVVFLNLPLVPEYPERI
jgi:hypothetical protein